MIVNLEKRNRIRPLRAVGLFAMVLAGLAWVVLLIAAAATESKILLLIFAVITMGIPLLMIVGAIVVLVYIEVSSAWQNWVRE